jgi:lipid II:glycine glycyltransferase (peptidoglycan interpeptide bridge formation enzyme)
MRIDISQKVGTGGLRPFSIQVSELAEERLWDDFVASCSGGHHEQTSLWSQVKACYGWHPVRGMVFRENRIVGGFQMLTKRHNWIGKIGYISRGPLWASEDPFLLSFIMQQLQVIARREKVALMVVVPNYDGNGLIPLLESAKFFRKPDTMPPTGLMSATLIIDLLEPVDQIRLRMRKTTRKNIRRSLNSQLQVREGNEDDVETFRSLMCQLCERRHVAPTPPERDFFQNLWGVFHPHNLLKIFIAELDHQPIAAHLAFNFGDTVRIWKCGWAGDHPNFYPNELLHWHMILWAKQNGFRYLDLVGLESDFAEKIIQGHPAPKDPKYGASFFKLGFGGRPVPFPDAYCKFFNVFFDYLVRVFRQTLFRSKLSQRFLNA